MQAEHVIAQCRWQGSFDQPDHAVALQDFISQWSNSVLKEELNRCFGARCPASQTWRIDSLLLDLGDIALNDLPRELPRRLRARLHDALDAMLAQQPAPGAAGSGRQPLLILDQGDTLEDFFSWFVRHGSAPWWFQEQRGILSMVDQLLAERPGAVADIVRDLGRAETVRQRLVWQLGEARVRRIVHLLEPWHGDFVCSYADNLFVVQAKRRLPDVGAADFRHRTWLHILSYLLVDRGTLFNTVAFIRAGIWRSAQHYRIAPETLLEQMFQAVRALRPMGSVSAAFLSAIEMIHAQETSSLAAPAPAAAPTSDDHWPAWQSMLRHGQPRGRIGRDSVAFDELFAALARQDAARMAVSLRREGAAAGVRQGLLRQLSTRGLALLVRVLEPQDHTFILAHVTHTQQLMTSQRWDKGTIWQVLLAYLLRSRGSHFDRRQMVRDTLQQVCKARGYHFDTLLAMLIHAASVEHPTHHRFELMAILRELRDAQDRRQRTSAHERPYWQPLLRYLGGGALAAARRLGPERGHGLALPGPRLMLAALLSGDTAHQRQALAALLRAPELAGVNDVLLSRRLLGLFGSADLPRLLALLAPDGAGLCLALYGLLLDGHRRGFLSSLDRADLALHLPAMLVQALPGFHQRRRGQPANFAPAAFWRRFGTLIKRQGRVDPAAWRAQLHHSLTAQAQPAGAPERRMLLALIESGAAPAPDSTPSTPRSEPPPLSSALARPQDMLRQWTALLRRTGGWLGADAVLEQQLARIFHSVGAAANGQRVGLPQLLARMTLSACQRLDLHLPEMLAGYRDQLPALPQRHWHEAYALLARRQDMKAAAIDAPAGAGFQQDPLGRHLDHPKLPAIVRHLLRYGHPPGWLAARGTVDLARLLHDLFHLRPEALPAVLSDIDRQPAARFRLLQIVPFRWLAEALLALAPAQAPDIALLAQWHRALEKIALPGVGRRQREALLFELVLRHGLAGDWAALAPEKLVAAFAWQLMRQRGVGAAALRQALAPQLGLLPERLRQACKVALEAAAPPSAPAIARPAPARAPAPRPPPAGVPMRINNAGLVLLQSYIQPLFSRLGLTGDGRFVSAGAQRCAVHYLQYLATGAVETPEPYLMLNKLLCGLAPHEPVELSIEITAEEAETCHGLLTAVMAYWPEAGSTSIDGLRGNWLVREGSVTDAGDHWHVIADRRAYDVLLARVPFSYSVIKLPWMQKAMYVTWPT